jgi:hypothetical protein
MKSDQRGLFVAMAALKNMLEADHLFDREIWHDKEASEQQSGAHVVIVTVYMPANERPELFGQCWPR